MREKGGDTEQNSKKVDSQQAAQGPESPEEIFGHELSLQFGDEMDDYYWDGPENSDEEIEELLPLKCEYEKELGIKYSKRGIIEFVEKFISQESS